MSDLTPSGSSRDLTSRVRVQPKIMPSSSTDKMLNTSNNSILLPRSQSTELAININENDIMGKISVVIPDNNQLQFNFSSKTTAKDLCRYVCEKIGVKQAFFFGLKRYKRQQNSNPQLNNLRIPWVWLSDNVEIFNQNCDSQTVLTLSLKYWFIDYKEVEDLKTADMMITEVKNLLLEGIYVVSAEAMACLVAIQLQLHGDTSSILTKKNITQYFPSYLTSKLNLAEFTRMVAINQNGLDHLNRLELSRRYLEYARTNVPNLTLSFFPAQYVNRDMIRKLKFALGVGPDGINIYEYDGKLEILSVIKYSEIESVECKKQSLIPGKEDEKGIPSPTIADIANKELDAASAKNLTKKPEFDESNLSNIEQQLVPGPYTHILKIFCKNKALREWKFETFSIYPEEAGVGSMIEQYRTRVEVYDQLLQTNFNSDYFLNVKLSDGSFCKKLQINSLDNGEQTLLKFAEKIGLKDHAFFQLASLDQGIYKWISLRQPVLIQARPNSDLYLRLRFFFTHPLEVKDPVARHLYFLQAREQVLSGKILATESNIVELAALSLAATIGNADEKKDLNSCVKEISQLVPDRLANLNSESNWRKKIIKSYESLLERSQESAEVKYLKVVSDLANYGISFFKAIIPKTGDRCLLGVGILGVCIYLENGMELLGFYRFGFELRSWKNISETIKFTVKASRNAEEKIVSVVCCQFSEALTLLAYYDQIRKTVKQTADINNF